MLIELKMNFMNTKKSLLRVLLVTILYCTFNLVSSCSTESDVTRTQQSKSNEVSLEQFKYETGIKKFDKSIRVLVNSSETTRNADGTYELSDFSVDTEKIKKVVVNEKTTYTFLVWPKVIRDMTFFNLVYYFKDNQWQTSIIELKPTSTNWEDLKNNSTVKFDGEIKNVANSDVSIYTVGNCTVIAVYDLHCTDPGQCLGEGGSCDGCSLCLSLELFTFCAEDFNLFTAPAEHPYTGGGGGGGHDDDTETPPTIIDPSGYIFDPNLPAIGEEYVRIQRATQFWGVLDSEQQIWSMANPDQYCDLLEFLLNNYSSLTPADMEEALDFLIVQPEMTPEDFPGKSDGLDFGWWLDEEQVGIVMHNNYDGFNNLTDAEKRLTYLYPIPAYKIKQNVPIAFAAVTQKFGQLQFPQGLNDKIDAFRHAYFLAINTKSTTKFYAKMFSDAHESEVAAGLVKEKQMDLYNNQKGIDYAIAQPQASVAQLVNMIYDLMNYGYLVYLSPLDFAASPSFDSNGNGQQDCNACLNGITTQTQMIYTNQ